MPQTTGDILFKLPSVVLYVHVLHRLIHLNTWSPVGRAVWEGLGGVTLAGEGVSLGVGFEISKAPAVPS